MTIAKSRPPPTFSGNVGRGGGRGRVKRLLRQLVEWVRISTAAVKQSKEGADM